MVLADSLQIPCAVVVRCAAVLRCAVAAVVCSIAELLQLTSLHLLHGDLGPEVDLSHWSSLRSLAELKLLPGEEGGLNELQVIAACK